MVNISQKQLLFNSSNAIILKFLHSTANSLLANISIKKMRLNSKFRNLIKKRITQVVKKRTLIFMPFQKHFRTKFCN